MQIKFTLFSGLIGTLLITLSVSSVYSVTPGDILENVEIRDADNKPATIPDLGKKVLTIFYTDPDVADQNDPLADAISDEEFSKETFRGMGIANLKDAPWKPDSIIRYIIRGKIEKYDSTILTDPDRLLIKAWNLGDCDEKGVVIVVGKNKKVLYYKKGPIRGEEIQHVLSIIRKATSE